MKKQILLLWLLSVSTLIFSQTNIDSLVQVGVQYHDDGQYDKAIETYKTALAADPNSALANYEISMTYLSINDYENALKHSDKVIRLNNGHLLAAYMAKGTCLDYMGKTKESIKLFKKGIKKFGDHYLLYYNLGYDYYKLKEYDKAEEFIIKAIKSNPEHASSHLMLGHIMAEKKQRVQSLLCLNYFLFLEPNSERAKTAYAMLKNQFGGHVVRDKDKPEQINIYISADQKNEDFRAAELMVSMLEASSKLEKNKEKTEEELFIMNTTSFFKILGEFKKEKDTGIWWDFYIPFFYSLAESEHIDTFCYYISQSSNTKAQEWLNDNNDRLIQFGTWLKNQ